MQIGIEQKAGAEMKKWSDTSRGFLIRQSDAQGTLHQEAILAAFRHHSQHRQFFQQQ